MDLQEDFACIFEVSDVLLPGGLFDQELVQDTRTYFSREGVVDIRIRIRLLDVIHGLLPLFQVSKDLDCFIKLSHLLLDLRCFEELSIDGHDLRIDFVDIDALLLALLIHQLQQPLVPVAGESTLSQIPRTVFDALHPQLFPVGLSHPEARHLICTLEVLLEDELLQVVGLSHLLLVDVHMVNRLDFIT